MFSICRLAFRRWAFAFLALLFAALCFAPTAGAQPEASSLKITDVMIPVADSIDLHGRLYRPKPEGEPRPAIFAMTPYTIDDFQGHEFGKYFASQGYAYLDVDVRGRGASEGTFRPLMGDGADGAAVAQWIAEQPWSDGQVAMRGGSYHGMVQWQTLAEGAGPIRTIVPTASVYPGWDFPNEDGIFDSYTARWLSVVRGRASQRSLFYDMEYWDEKYRAFHRSGRPFAEYGEFAGLTLHAAQVFERWIEHPHLDNYWQSASPDSADYSQMDLPVLTITGHFDADQPGALRYYRKHIRHGPPQSTEQHYLLMGPWNHRDTRLPDKVESGFTFADNAAIDMNRLHKEWFDWVLKDGSKPELLEDQVVYYVMGAGKWRAAPSLEEVADTSRSLYLQSPGKNPEDPFDAGQLTPRPPEEEEVDQYVYNPRDTADIATLEAMDESNTAPGAAFLEGPKLVYHSPPMEESFEMSGQMRLDAWIELDVPDTDLAAWVYEIRPTGRVIYLGWTKLRARHRNGVHSADLIEPGEVQRYRFDRFYWTSRQVKEGSRIRLVIAPLNDPEYQKNYNSGAPPMQESVEDARTATVKLHIGPDRPSKLSLPVRSGEEDPREKVTTSSNR